MINTLKYTKKLEGVGISREHAEAHVQMIAEVFENDLATKQDLIAVRQDLMTVKGELKSDIYTLGIALAEFKGETTARFARLENKIDGMEQRLFLRLCVAMGAMMTVLLTIFRFI